MPSFGGRGSGRVQRYLWAVLQVKVEPEPAGLALLLSLSLPRSSPSLPGSNQPWICCSGSEEPFRNTSRDQQDWGWELAAQALPATIIQLSWTVLVPRLFTNPPLSKQNVPGHEAGDVCAPRRAEPAPQRDASLSPSLFLCSRQCCLA